MARKRNLRPIHDPVLTVDASATKAARLVYLLVLHKPIPYENGRSRIAYIGTTEKGVTRIAQSAGERLGQAIDRCNGVRRMSAYVVWTQTKRGQQTKHGRPLWKLLERGFILRFKEIFGEKPRFNEHGKKFRRKEREPAFRAFSEKAIENIILSFGGLPPVKVDGRKKKVVRL